MLKAELFDKAVLCYVDRSFAYFTTGPLSEAWGDDWNDAPYEHNSGTPYGPVPGRPEDWNEDGSPRWEILKVAFSGSFEEPKDGHRNSPFSVEAINSGAAPWLFSRYDDVEISAGVTICEFIRLVKKTGGEVYLPV